MNEIEALFGKLGLDHAPTEMDKPDFKIYLEDWESTRLVMTAERRPARPLPQQVRGGLNLRDDEDEDDGEGSWLVEIVGSDFKKKHECMYKKGYYLLAQALGAHPPVWGVPQRLPPRRQHQVLPPSLTWFS